jgi:hypothetical protein
MKVEDCGNAGGDELLVLIDLSSSSFPIREEVIPDDDSSFFISKRILVINK